MRALNFFFGSPLSPHDERNPVTGFDPTQKHNLKNLLCCPAIKHNSKNLLCCPRNCVDTKWSGKMCESLSGTMNKMRAFVRENLWEFVRENVWAFVREEKVVLSGKMNKMWVFCELLSCEFVWENEQNVSLSGKMNKKHNSKNLLCCPGRKSYVVREIEQKILKINLRSPARRSPCDDA